MNSCGTCNRDAPPDGSTELASWLTSNHGATLTCPECVTRRIETDDAVLHEMETAEGWDRPEGRSPRSWPEP